jgi:hypothetical protein
MPSYVSNTVNAIPLTAHNSNPVIKVPVNVVFRSVRHFSQRGTGIPDEMARTISNSTPPTRPVFCRAIRFELPDTQGECFIYTHLARLMHVAFFVGTQDARIT